MARGLAAEVRKRRGRPARLSREAILEAGLALLERAPDEPLTLAGVAEEVGAVPAALYRHVGSQAELLDGVLARVIGGVALQIRRRARWETQLRDWMTGLRAHLLRYPAALRLLGSRERTSPPWLELAAQLVCILESAGLVGAELARVQLWVMQTTMGFVIEEAAMPLPDQIGAAQASLREMSPAGREKLAPLLPHLAKLDADRFFDFVVEQTLAALKGSAR
jgi:AcrR family transcriptional regulator